MKFTLITVLYLISSYLQASEYLKFCFDTVNEEKTYQATVNNTNKFDLLGFVQTCINGVGNLEKDNVVKIYKNNKEIQSLIVNFKSKNSSVACIGYSIKQNRWVSSFAPIGVGSCEFNNKL